MRDAARWIRARHPHAPDALLARPGLRSIPDEEGADPDGSAEAVGDAEDSRDAGDPGDRRAGLLARRGAEILDGVVGAAPDERETAFRLLEADALLTYACEAAVDAEDPEASLRAVLEALLPGARPGV